MVVVDDALLLAIVAARQEPPIESFLVRNSCGHYALQIRRIARTNPGAGSGRYPSVDAANKVRHARVTCDDSNVGCRVGVCLECSSTFLMISTEQ